jgi:two-component system, OmpR family, KDP operon response regulator KdpE
MSGCILIIDDEAQIRKLLRVTLESAGFAVLEADTGKKGIVTTATKDPALILLDLGLPDESGHDVLKHLREWFTRPVIILSGQSGSEDIGRALDQGANDYITKPLRSSDVLARIRASIRNFRKEKNVPVANYGDLSIDYVSRTVTKRKTAIKLTPAEYTLLCIMAQNETKVFTHQYLLAQAWRRENQHDLQYLRVFIGNLRKKIEDDPSSPRYIVNESGIGYRFAGGSSHKEDISDGTNS